MMRMHSSVQKLLSSTHSIEAGAASMLNQPGLWLANTDISQGLRLRKAQAQLTIDGLLKMGLLRRVELGSLNGRGGWKCASARSGASLLPCSHPRARVRWCLAAKLR
jgi:hypothetical protein